MKLTEDNIEVNFNDEYYFREGNVCVLVSQEGKTGEQIKQQILENQDKADLYDALNDAKGKEFIKGVIKNQQKLEKIEEWIKELDNNPNPVKTGIKLFRVSEKLKSILESKKE